MANDTNPSAIPAVAYEPPIKRVGASLPSPLSGPQNVMGEGLNTIVDTKGLETLLSTKAAAAVLGISGRTLEDLRWKGRSPPYLQLSRNCIRYRHCDLIEWAVSRRVQSTTDAHFRKA